jgi:hypothetical protein
MKNYTKATIASCLFVTVGIIPQWYIYMPLTLLAWFILAPTIKED